MRGDFDSCAFSPTKASFGGTDDLLLNKRIKDIGISEDVNVENVDSVEDDSFEGGSGQDVLLPLPPNLEDEGEM